MTVAACLTACAQPGASRCERAYEGARESGDYRTAVEACAEPAIDASGRRAVLLAQARLQLGDRQAAAAVAERLQYGPRASVGLQLLGRLALERRELEEAVALLERAVARARDDRDRMVAATDLAEARWRVGQWQAALDAIEVAIAAARASGNEVYVRGNTVQRIRVLYSANDLREAEDAAQAALADTTAPCDQIWPRFLLGQVHSAAQDRAELAVAAFEEVQHDRAACKTATLDAEDLDLNLAWAHFEAGDLDKASADLDRLDESPETLLIRARIADRRGDRAGTAAALSRARAIQRPEDLWGWEISYLTAQAAEVVGDVHGAAREYGRAIDEITALRSRSRGSDGLTVARYRGVYDGLVALLARQARWRDALAVVLELDASDMLRSTAVARHGASGAGDTLATVEPAVDRPTGAVTTMQDAWRGRDLVVLVATSPRELGPGGERVYRLWLHDGRVEGAEVGDAAQARSWARDLFAKPTDATAAEGLGTMLSHGLPDRALDVLLIGPLGVAPLAALRDQAALLIARRPLARVLSIRPRPAAKLVASGRQAVVLADPQGNLPAATAEGAQVADAVDGSLFAGPAATSDRLWSARAAELLHVASHVDDRERTRWLRLADRAVSPTEIVEHALAPRLAVLASCGAAAAQDEEGWGSLAQAFLVAGSEHVIAADRTVRDGDAAALVAAFYGQPGWRTDPVRALAAAQLELSRSNPAGDWAAFEVLAAPPRGAP